MTEVIDCDAIVVGGGPAGSAAASVLARAGRRVVVLERTTFPRYHIGESLLPYCWFTLERIGALEAIDATGFQCKTGVRFVSADGRMSRPFDFREHLDHPAACTWMVERSSFDSVLLEHAGRCGAEVRQHTRATGLVEVDGRVIGVDAVGPDGPLRLRAPWTIDCTGRDGFARTLKGWRNPESSLDRVALWTYYRDLPMDPDTASTTTVVQVSDDGWFWVIPLAGGLTSVGIVARRDVLFRNSRDRAQIWTEQVGKNRWMVDLLDGVERASDFHLTADYSYRSSYCADEGLVLAGDAFAFLDPVFSSGVFLALVTGEAAAQGVIEALDAGRTDAGVFEAYGEWLCSGIEAMRRLVFSFYDPQFSMGRMVRAYPHLQGDVTDLLIGNVFRDYHDLDRALREFAQLPEPLPYGRARVVAS